jgi:hypothetical protein
MRKISLLFLLIAGMVAVQTTASAQATGSTYKTAIGFKFSPTAITVKHFVKENAALEGLGYFWKDGFRLTGLYEWHGNIKGAAGLKWYVGGGAHIDLWDNDYRNNHNGDGKAAFGLDGVLGLDYKFKGAPINLSLDWQPSVTFANDNYSNVDWVGVAIRFAF